MSLAGQSPAPAAVRNATTAVRARSAASLRSLEQAAVVRDEDDRAGVAVERGLELLDRRQVEVVRRLVQDEAVDALRRRAGELGARSLAR